MDAKISTERWLSEQFDQAYVDQLITQFEADESIVWLPVRHHSPACADFTLQQLDESEPDAVLIEVPANYQPLLANLQHPDTVPPIAIYEEGTFFPLSLNSAEWQALRWAKAHDKAVYFIDLPLDATETKEHRWNESVLLSSQFSQHLQKRLWARDYDELWMTLFEQTSFESPKAFFRQLYLFCAASRACYTQSALEQKGDIQREAQMSRWIRRLRQRYRKLAVLTGGFHTPALTQWRQVDETPPIEQSRFPAYLIRYSDEQLDSLNGYQSGMPFPAFNRWWFEWRRKQASSSDWLLNLVDRIPMSLEVDINIASKLALIRHLEGLTVLREHVSASPYDLVDSLKSCLIKDEYRPDNPLILELKDLFTGYQLGSLPSAIPELPLVDAFKEECREVRLTTDTSEQKNSYIDLYDASDKAKKRRYFFYRCAYLGLPFASQLHGPNFAKGLNLERQHEAWTYRWTPQVDAKLILLSQFGGSIESVTRARLEEDWLTDCEFELFINNIIEVVTLGFGNWLEISQQNIEARFLKESDIAQLTSAMTRLLTLKEHPIFIDSRKVLGDICQVIWQQITYHLGQINSLPLQSALDNLISCHGIALTCEEYAPQWLDRLRWLRNTNTHTSPIYFAIYALETECQRESSDIVTDEINLLYATKPESALEVVNALLHVVPHWLKHSDTILNLLNLWINGLTEEHFQARLPQLRRLFCVLDAQEIDTVAARLVAINRWDGPLNWVNSQFSEQSMLRAQQLQLSMAESLKQKGLEQWLKD
uniref:DUF5682 family protein n=1 Tax=Thaumasiovibrio occultus TaxID=1891184 RepID=UPI000B354EF4|nr:DUF5682 family protein [Thaumasiovibrio occultus]